MASQNPTFQATLVILVIQATQAILPSNILSLLTLLAPTPSLYKSLKITKVSSLVSVALKCKKPGGQTIFRSNLIGFGDNNTPLRSEINHSTGGIPFGPFDHSVTLLFTIENGHSSKGPFRLSRVIKPITVNRPPSGNHCHYTQVSTILSEDGDDNDFNDAIITVFAFK